MMILYDYQKRIKQTAYKFLKQGGIHAIICAAPRSGKTVIFSSIAKDFNTHNKKVLVLTDRTELLNQSGNTFKKFGLNPFYIQAGCKVVSKTHMCFVAMSQTLRNRIGATYWDEFIQSIDLVIIDEIHIQDFNYIFESQLLDNIWTLGFTGTPSRKGKMRQLGLDFQKIISEISISELLKLDRLVNCDVFGFEAPSCSDVKISAMNGDYDKKQLFAKFDKRNLYTGVVKNYREICDNTKFICYCISKVHAIKTAIEFHEAGYNVKFIVSDTGRPKPPEDTDNAGKMTRYNIHLENYELFKKWYPILSGERSQLFKDFADNKFLGLINVDICTKGYDCPQLETVILNYKTISLTRYLQSSMRGATAYPQKVSYTLLDFGGNVSHFGMPLEDRLYSLWHEKSDSEGLPPVKNCGYTGDGQPILVNGTKGCNRMILGSMTICPFCGFKYPEKVLTEGELQTLFLDNQQKKVVKTKRVRDMSNSELYFYWKSKGHKSAWLWRQLWYRGKENSIVNFGKEYGWSYGTIKKAIGFCEMFN